LCPPPEPVPVSVALMSPRFWPEVRRGTERFALELARRVPGATIVTSGAGPKDVESVPVLRVPRLPEARLERRGFERHLTHVPFARAEQPTILCAADPGEPRKRVGLLVEAFAHVRRDRPDARLVLDRRAPAADGVERRDLDGPLALADANREAWVSVLPSWGEA